MSDNIFFDVSRLKHVGNRVIIGRTVRIRYPELVEMHDDTIIDDFVFVSTGLIMGKHSTIMPNSTITGGATNQVIMGNYSGIASCCSIMTSTHDLVCSLHLIHRNDIDQEFRRGSVVLEDHVMVGCNSTIMPGIRLSMGSRVAAQSFVNADLEPWTLYGGIPAKPIKAVDQKSVLRQLKNYQERLVLP